VDNSLPRVLAHLHCATTTALSLRNPMVDPTRTSGILLQKGRQSDFGFCDTDGHHMSPRISVGAGVADC
jgi:hypothetical protein